MGVKNLEQIFLSFNDLRVLIIGDVMVDSYILGKVERISPEAPVPVVHIQKREKRLGGAANVALNVQALGAKPLLCTVIGDDLEGNVFIDLLAKKNIGTKGIIRSKARITTVKERVISGSQHILRIDSEMDTELESSEEKKLIELIKDLILESDVVIFEDYDKGIITPTLIEETINFANSRNVPTVVDPKKRNFLNYNNATLFKPNLKELREGLKLDFDPGDIHGLSSAVAMLKTNLSVKNIMVTLSEKGVFIESEEGKYHLPAHYRSISDVSGAGDTVVSIAAVCIARGLPAKFIAALSNLGGGLVCEHLGVVPIDKQDLYDEAVKNNLGGN
jgi:rfaE bifunctional protein kinase chain/domain